MQSKVVMFFCATLSIACSSGITVDTENDAGDGDVSDNDGGNASACTAEATEECEYKPLDYQIGELEGFIVQNPILERNSPILFRYPVGVSGPLPVVIWTHGGDYDIAGHRKSSAWGATLAAAGYAVIHVAHVPPTPANLPRLCDAGGIPQAECNAADALLPAVTHPLDVTSTLDELDAIEAWAADLVGVSFDETKILSGGWSAGSFAPLGVLGSKRIASPTANRFDAPDDRVLGAIALSTQGDGFSGYFTDGAETSWDQITRPVLVMTGDNDWKPGNPDLLGAIRRQAYDELLGTNGDQRLLYSFLPIGVGGHGTYNLGDRDSSDPTLVQLSLALQSAARAFADEVLLGSEEAKAYLDSNALSLLAGSELLEQNTK